MSVISMRILPKDEPLGWTPYAWTVYLAFFLITPVVMHASPLRWTLTIASLALFLALYFRAWWVNGLELGLIVAAMTALGTAWLPYNGGAGAFFIYAAASAPFIGSPRTSVIAIALIETVTISSVLAFHIPIWNALWPVIFVVIIGATNMHQAASDKANARLRLAQDEIEHLAKVAERERIARDLHDLLGHTLSLIVLKSELASKLAERDADRARTEIRDVERISRDALAQVRSAVGGFRSGGLQAEVDAARAALTSANVTLDASIDRVQLAPAHEAVLALAIREAVTNVIRHAHARHCTISLRATPVSNTLTITDDGRGGVRSSGYGLIGMKERVSSLGGTLTHEGDRGTTLTIAIPANAQPAIAERSA
jgi:two-component system sensor histidine kinase DesK